MASFFRASCAIYWITWLVTLAYMVGISVYEHKFVVQTEEYDIPSAMIKGLCVVNIVYALVGCIFVKCDISHFGCLLVYGIPTLLVVPGLSIWGITKCKTIQDKEMNTSTLLGTFGKTYASSRNSPLWLREVEIDSGCCGIRSWRDYKLIKEADDAIPQDQTVPPSCCKGLKNLRKGEDEQQKHCLEVLKNRTMFGTAEDFPLSQGDIQRIMKEGFTRKEINVTGFPVIHPDFRNGSNLINRRGCATEVKDRFKAALDAHVAFFVILLICSLLMLMVYLKNWCDSRHFNGGLSDHSLDVETLSLLDLKDLDRNDRGDRETPSITLETPSQLGSGVSGVIRPSLAPSQHSQAGKPPPGAAGYVPASVRSSRKSNSPSAHKV